MGVAASGGQDNPSKSRCRGITATQPILVNGKMLKIHYLLLQKANAWNFCTFSYLFAQETCPAYFGHLSVTFAPENAKKNVDLDDFCKLSLCLTERHL